MTEAGFDMALRLAGVLTRAAPPREILPEAAEALRALFGALSVTVAVTAPEDSATAGSAPPDALLAAAPLRAEGRTLGRLEVRTAGAVVPAAEVARAADLLGAALLRSRAAEAGRSEAERALSEAAHELRTPLTAIRSFAEVLLAETPADAPTREYVAVIQEEAVRLSRLVARLSDLSRLRAGRAALDLAEGDFAAAARSAALSVAGAAALKGVRIRERFPADLPMLRFDRDRVVQVFVNLLANAVRHSPEGGEVVVEISALPGAVTASVADAGPGVPPADRETIFTGRPGGGLGLAISRDIVRAHGGVLSVSDAPGGGAQFTFTLPVAG